MFTAPPPPASFTWPADFVAVMVEDSFSDSKVSPGVEYYYRVTPVNVAGIGPSLHNLGHHPVIGLPLPPKPKQIYGGPRSTPRAAVLFSPLKNRSTAPIPSAHSPLDQSFRNHDFESFRWNSISSPSRRPRSSRPAPDPTPDPRIWTVGEITRTVRTLLESSLGELWIEGEICNFRRQSSGHCYFSLKDGARAALLRPFPLLRTGKGRARRWRAGPDARPNHRLRGPRPSTSSMSA